MDSALEHVNIWSLKSLRRSTQGYKRDSVGIQEKKGILERGLQGRHIRMLNVVDKSNKVRPENGPCNLASFGSLLT